MIYFFFLLNLAYVIINLVHNVNPMLEHKDFLGLLFSSKLFFDTPVAENISKEKFQPYLLVMKDKR